MRILVTGGSGFVGQHLLEHLGRELPNAELFAYSRSTKAVPGVRWIQGDVRDRKQLTEAARDVSPDAVIHLAGASRINHGT